MGGGGGFTDLRKEKKKISLLGYKKNFSAGGFITSCSSIYIYIYFFRKSFSGVFN
jgi:hypothetical protein